MRRVALFVALFLMGPPVLAASPVTGRASVIDGDTLEIRDKHFRLFGIDAPEGRQRCRLDGTRWPCGRRAAFALSDHIGVRPVTCVPTGKRSWKRLVARCSLAGEDLAAWLVREGWAVNEPRFTQEYLPLEDAARHARRGLWQGAFTMPWDCRKGAPGC